MIQMDVHKDLGQLLLEEGLITAPQLQAARQAQLAQEKSIGRVLVELGLITDQAKMAFIHKKFKIEMVDIAGIVIQTGVLTRIPRSYAERFRALPVLVEHGTLIVAMEDPTDLQVLDEIKLQTGMDIQPVLAPVADIEKALLQYPAMSQKQVDRLQQDMRGSAFGRLLHPALFLTVMIAPLAAFVLGVWLSLDFGTFLTRVGSPFDVTLYGVLGWVLWAILVWEIDGLLFGRPSA